MCIAAHVLVAIYSVCKFTCTWMLADALIIEQEFNGVYCTCKYTYMHTVRFVVTVCVKWGKELGEN